MHQILVILFCYSLTCALGKTLSNNSKTYTEEEGLQNEISSLNSTCETSFECAGKLLCYSGICRCSNDLFWNGTNCLMRKSHLLSCNESSECKEKLQCTENTCQCEKEDYWNGITCTLKKSFKDDCVNTAECGSNLYCARKICQCTSSEYWTGSTCALRKTLNISCLSSVECSDSLRCFEDKCQCCETEYWNGTFCVLRKLPNEPCVNDQECKNELLCYTNLCKCSDNKYWNQNHCKNKKSFSDACSTTVECIQTLYCLNGQCTCKAEDYRTTSGCTERKGFESKCVSTHECQHNLDCTDYRCTCIAEYYWDGHNCSKLPKECADIQSDIDGVYTIYPVKKTSAYCIMRGTKKWTVIQRRMDGSVDFYRNWTDYKTGFGCFSGEYWLGNDNIHSISTNGDHELSVYLEDWAGNIRFANYTTFRIGDEENKYMLTVSGYSGDAGDSLTSGHNGRKFSTKGQNNDVSSGNCAVFYRGAWWYNNCYESNLNGQYNGTSHKGVVWHGIKVDYSLRKTLLMIRQR